MKSARERITIARTNLVIDHPFYGVLSLRLKIVDATSDPTIQTMATDGEHLYFNERFVQSLKMDELMGSVAHETLHCAMGHQWRRDARDPERWNIACDYAINPVVVGSATSGSGLNLKLPQGCLLDDQYKGKSSEWIYAHLQEKGGKGGKGGKSGKGQHGPGQCGCDGVRDAKDGAPSTSEWATYVNEAANAARAAGKLPGNLAGFVDQLNEPKIDWKAQLRRFVQEIVLHGDYTWRRPASRYIHTGAYLPSAFSTQTPPLAVAFDTSGSIADSELVAFVSEMQSIIDEVKPEVTHSIQCDAAVTAPHVDYFADDFLGKVEIHGRGGTRFEPVFEYVDQNGLTPAVLIYLTDLCGSFPATPPDYPVIWVATEKGEAPFGETIYLDDGGAQ